MSLSLAFIPAPMNILVLGVTLMHCRAPAAGLRVMDGISELEMEGVKTVLAVGG